MMNKIEKHGIWIIILLLWCFVIWEGTAGATEWIPSLSGTGQCRAADGSGFCAADHSVQPKGTFIIGSATGVSNSSSRYGISDFIGSVTSIGDSIIWSGTDYIISPQPTSTPTPRSEWHPNPDDILSAIPESERLVTMETLERYMEDWQNGDIVHVSDTMQMYHYEGGAWIPLWVEKPEKPVIQSVDKPKAKIPPEPYLSIDEIKKHVSHWDNVESDDPVLQSIELVNGQIEAIYRQVIHTYENIQDVYGSPMRIRTYIKQVDFERVWKDIYVAELRAKSNSVGDIVENFLGVTIVFKERIDAKLTPAETKETPERIEWPK